MSASTGWTAVCLFLMNLSIYTANDNLKLVDVLQTTTKLISYYKENHREMNLDGIYGLRAIEGQVKNLLDEYSNGRHQHLSASELSSLQTIWQDANNISEMSLPYLKQYDPEYYEKLKPLVDRPVKISKEYRRIDLDLQWSKHVKQQAKKDTIFNEDFSDGCMAELMGTGRQDRQQCVLTDQCLRAMLITRGTVEYHLTHQLLYTILAEQSGCSPKLDEFLASQGETGGVDQLQKEFCSNHYLEVQQQVLSVNGVVIPVIQDLFMEEEFVCPVLGFMEFLHVDWLKQIIAWQKPSGCYGRMKVTNFGKKYKMKDFGDYEYEDQHVGQNQNGPEMSKNQDFQKDIARNNDVQMQQVGITNNVVVQQGMGSDNKLLMKMANDSANVIPNAQFNNVVNVGAGEALPLHDLDIKANDGLRDPVNKQMNQNQMNQQQILPNLPQNTNYGAVGNNVNSNGGAYQGVENRQQNNMNAQIMAQNNAGAPVRGVTSSPLRNRPDPLDKLEPNKWQHPFQDKKAQDYHADRVILRKMLVEKELEMGCLSHKTAVAAGALSQYLRFMVNPGTTEYQQHVRVDGPNHLLLSIGGHHHQFGRNQKGHANNQVFNAQQNQVGANGMLGQIKPPLDLVKKDVENEDEGAGDLEDEQQGEEIEIPDQGLDPPLNKAIIDDNDETIHVDPNQDKDEEHEEYDEDDNYDDANENKDEDANYLDNNNNENDSDENNGPRQHKKKNQAHINPKFQRHFDLKGNGAKPQADDQEYEQYLDEEEIVNNDKPIQAKLPGGNNAHGLQIPNAQLRHFDGREQNDDADQGYNYYANRDENEEMDDSVVREQISDQNIYPREKITRTSYTANLPQMPSAQNSNHIGKAYLLLLITMFGLMYLMYRFVRQRRVVIKYHHRSHYR